MSIIKMVAKITPGTDNICKMDFSILFLPFDHKMYIGTDIGQVNKINHLEK